MIPATKPDLTASRTETRPAMARPPEVRNDPAWDAKPDLLEICRKAAMFDAAMAIIADDHFIADRPMNPDCGIHRTRDGASLTEWDVEYGSIQWGALVMSNCLLRLRTQHRAREGWGWDHIERAAQALAETLRAEA